MEKPEFPAVTIITVNFNGRRFLPGLFNSIGNLNYPRDKIQTVMVDNGSNDGSCDLVRQHFSWIEILETGKNLGYAGGNNAGMRVAKGKYIALINNDCIVEKDWLVEMVRTAEQPEKKSKAGAVGSKVLFFFKFIPLEFLLDGGSAEISGLSIKPLHFFSEDDLIKSVKLLGGCSLKTREGACSSWRWRLEKYALIGFPVPDSTKDTEINFDIRPDGNSANLKIAIKKTGNQESMRESDDEFGGEVFSSPIMSQGMHVRITAGQRQYSYTADIVNSCGLEVNKSFYARDRGSSNFDLGQFEKEEEIFCPSGSSLLVRKEMLEDTGYFDEDFFTYYEDIDLFWRSRLMGWKAYFTPFSVARHLHCGTGIEWSYSFTYHVLRNRLIAIFKNGWPGLVLKNYAAFIFSGIASTIFYITALLLGKKQQRPDIKARFIIFFKLFYYFAKKLILRIKIRKNARAGDSEIKKLLVDF